MLGIKKVATPATINQQHSAVDSSLPNAKINSISNSSNQNDNSSPVEEFNASTPLDSAIKAVVEFVSEVARIAKDSADGTSDPASKLKAGTVDAKMVEEIYHLNAEKIGGGIKPESGVQGFCIVDGYIVMAIVDDNDNATLYLVDMESFEIKDSIDIGPNHANVLSYDPKSGTIFVGNTKNLPVTLEIKDGKLSKSETNISHKGQILYNEQNDSFVVANGTDNGTTVDIYTRDEFYKEDGKPKKSFIIKNSEAEDQGKIESSGNYSSQGKATYGNHIYYCLSRKNGESVILVYNMSTGKLEQVIQDRTKYDSTISDDPKDPKKAPELEQVYFDSEGNMYANYNDGNDFYETDYNYYDQTNQKRK